MISPSWNLRKKRIIESINSAERKKQLLVNHFRLLFSTDKSLVNAVHEAFKLLGFDNLKEGRGPDKEDLIFEFDTIGAPITGVIEVKGINGRLKKSHIDQCSGWASEYEDLKKNPKGILIPNQFRLKPYSKHERLNFSSNLHSDAKARKICVLPSPVLFEAVNQTLTGNKKSRKEIEKHLLETNGILFSLVNQKKTS